VVDTNGLGLANKHGVTNRTWLINAQVLKKQKKLFMNVLVRVEFYFSWFAVINLG
jgi:hypothetical protein